MLLTLIFLFLLIAIIALLYENRNMLKNVLIQISHIKQVHNEDETSRNLLKFKENGLFTNDEYEEKVRLYKHLRSKENYHHDKKILLHMLENGIITEQEYEKKVNDLESILETQIWETSPEIVELKKKTGLTFIKHYAIKKEDSWICVCGTENKLNDKNCVKCTLNQEYVLNTFVKNAKDI